MGIWKRCVVVLAVVCTATPTSARPRRSAELTDRDKLYWDAAQALFGAGLKIKRNKRSTTISPGSLTQDTYNRYVKEVYLEVLRSSLAKLTGGYWRWKTGGYGEDRFQTRSKVKRAHLLLEPFLKYKLCRAISGAIGDKPNIVASRQRTGWCALEAAQEAIAPIYVYRGAEVTWKAPADKGDLEVDDEIWTPDGSGNYPMVITVRGGSNIYTLASTDILMRLAKEVDEHLAPKLRKKADALYDKTLKVYHKLEKAEARKQLKLTKGKKIIFGDKRFYATVAQPPSTGPTPCMSTFFLAYAPKKARQQGYHLGIKIDGNECAAYPIDAGEEDRSDIFTQPSCSRLLKPGEHKVTVAMHENIDEFNYKRKEWRRKNMQWKRQNVTYTKTRAGKLLYDASITCAQK